MASDAEPQATKAPLRVLIAEDDPADVELIVRELRRAGFNIEWRVVDNEADYVSLLRPDVDLVLSDYSMPQFDGSRALDLLRERDPDLPFIIVSGTIGEDVAVSVMRQGATDYLLKDRLGRLGPAVQQALDQGRLRREGRRAALALAKSEQALKEERARLVTAHEALRTSLSEKEALLREVHHRVKNNLQVITSFLRLEARRTSSDEARVVLREMQGRIFAMALLHETLYRSGNFRRVDIAAYLNKLAVQLFRSQNVDPSEVRLVLNLTPVELELDQAVPCGLIVNELLANSLKHGFPSGLVGEVRLSVGVELDKVRLEVTDTGAGLAADFEPRRTKSLGLQIVADLTRQLRGEFRIGPGPLAQFTAIFPLNTPSRSA